MAYSPMELAEVFLKTGELDDALEALNQQLSADPSDDYARRLRIRTNMRVLNDEDLNTVLDDLKKLSQKSAEDYHIESILHQKMEDLPSAIRAIDEARNLDPQQERFTERLIELLLMGQQYDEALEVIRQQTQDWRWLEREGDVLVLLGNDILATARYGLVLSHLSERDNTMNAEYLQALKLRVILARAHAYRRFGHTDLARDLYKAAREIVKDDVTIDFNLGLLSEMDGNRTEAVKLCQFALDNASSALRHSMLESLNNPQFSELKHSLAIE